ncbi:Alpha beta fold family [Colletotrichum higginsianum IMI 349063]|uniref:Alpha beta fold family n=1 Tax=Colletotrichum higginsianum (strain IMI 349063) TaxID=759273 RepID=A0A1B7YJD4_COLHI|nr:Alpha beta fold family [Colletotrichum higginsianum IMI 349063]OBR11958.1 Alpha beta fold family [Colletotrichum higginsianum IMI 349063]
MDWLGYAKIDFTHAPSPVSLSENDGNQTDLLKVCEKITPPCRMNPLLFNGHLQTMWTATKQHGPPVYYRRKVFHAEDKAFDGTFAVDFVTEPFKDVDSTLPPRTKYFEDQDFETLPSDDDRPQLIVLHGLSGGSHEIYLRHAIAPLIDSGKWEVCVVNSRGCANSKFTSGILYNARATWDFRQYCGEEGVNCELTAAIACSNPFNLEVANKALKRNFLGREVYQRVMGTSMKQLIADHKEEVQKHTNLDLERIQNLTYLWEFDREVQCISWGYPTESAYYRDASSCDAVLAIRIPFLALHATDDPIAVNEAIPYEEFEKNPYTVLCTTSLGGHLCWFEPGGGRWHAKPVANFFNHMAFNVDHSQLPPKTTSAPPTNGKSEFHFNPVRRKMEIKAGSD